ncbi:MAG: ABC transporter substrate-binding protein [Candidatus Nanopelagicales bacterium]|nr:ABC transporter substrate-binding protein [Candidatus Nanopelagicales bacterium]
MRKMMLAVVSVAASSLVLAGCSSSEDTATDTATATESTSEVVESAAETAASEGAFGMCGNSFEELVSAAQAEGTVNLIALPDTWANYGGILESFRTTYGIDAPVANPDASSADELTAIKTLRGQPDMPDNIDIGPSFVTQAIEEGLIEPYQTSNWDQIPDVLKGADGNWIGSYYGIMSIATNSTLVPNAPTTWEDLKKPEYKGMVTLNGDPREAGAAFAAVVAASLANGGSYSDLMPGIEYFAELKKSGNLQTIDVTEAALLSGEVPIALDWTYNFPGVVAQLAEVGFDMKVVVPSDGIYGAYYAQSVVSDPVHPCAARLWMEHVTGDAGALGYLEGGAIPARFAAMQEAGVIPAEAMENLPSADLIQSITFPTAEETELMKSQLTEFWGPMVADA